MRPVRPACAAALIAALSVGVAPAGTDREARSGPPRVLARLTPMQEVPPIASPARGAFSATLDAEARTISYELHYEGFDSEVLQAHLHAAQPGVNGGIMVWLCGSVSLPGPPGTPPCPPPPATISGELTAEQIVGPAAQGISPGEFDEVLRAIQNGVTYANVHTTRYPAGEIRGQLRRGWSEPGGASGSGPAAAAAIIDGGVPRAAAAQVAVNVAAYCSRSRAFCTLPIALRGRSSTKYTRFGCLKRARRPASAACTSASVSAAPVARATTATTPSPKSGCGTPITADSTTPGSASISSSISFG